MAFTFFVIFFNLHNFLRCEGAEHPAVNFVWEDGQNARLETYVSPFYYDAFLK